MQCAVSKAEWPPFLSGALSLLEYWSRVHRLLTGLVHSPTRELGANELLYMERKSWSVHYIFCRALSPVLVLLQIYRLLWSNIGINTVLASRILANKTLSTLHANGTGPGLPGGKRLLPLPGRLPVFTDRLPFNLTRVSLRFVAPTVAFVQCPFSAFYVR